MSLLMMAKSAIDIIGNMSNSMMAMSTLDVIGNTPLVRLNRFTKGLDATIAVKLEHKNPAGSVKDRVAFNMISTAEAEGKIVPGKTVLIEPTSGNMEISLAFCAALKGYIQAYFNDTSSMSVERRALLKAFGTGVILTDSAKAIKGAIDRAHDLAKVIPNSHIPNQFSNAANPLAHYLTTGPEIWKQTEGKVDIVCFGVGSGGTCTGVGRYLKEHNPEIKVYPVEPFESSAINGFPHNPHKIQGIGVGMVPETLDCTLFNDALHLDDAIAMAKRLAHEEALICGISSGANVHAALQLAKRPENKGKLIVTTINSSGERYLSTPLYADIRDKVAALEEMSLEESIADAIEFLRI